jgi:hypothetical protein
MVYIIEIKNLKCNKGKAIVKQAIYENFKQLRNYCLANKKMTVDGIASNFGVWHLTRYRKEDELLGREAFQITEEFNVMDNNEEHFDEKELRRLVFALQWMCLVKRECYVKQEYFKKEEINLVHKQEPPVFSADGA